MTSTSDNRFRSKIAALRRRSGQVGGVCRFVAKSGVMAQAGIRGALVALNELRQGRGGPPLLYRINAANTPSRLAVVCGERRISFAELDERADRIAGALHAELGIKAGDAVVVMTPNCLEVLELQAAVMRLGASLVFVSWRSTESELSFLADDCGARLIVSAAQTTPTALRVAESLPSLSERSVVCLGGASVGGRSYRDLLKGEPYAPSERASAARLIVYTSGTTGKPKGAVREFPVWAQLSLLSFVAETPIRSDDRHLVVCPMYHSTAFAFASFTMLVAGRLVIMPRFEAEQVLETIERERITTTAMVPTMLHRLLALPDEVFARYDTSSLRVVFSGGAPLTGDLAARFMQRFGHVLYNFYGATETGISTLATPEELLLSPGTIGHVVPGNELRLLTEQGTPAAEGCTGELYVRNDMLIARYHQRPDATRSSMRDGFFSVGDLAHFDAHGLLHIDGRKRDMNISGGVNVYPAELEEVLCQHPAVMDAAVIGAADPEWGETVCAFLVLNPSQPTSEDEIHAFCRDRMQTAKRPRRLIFVDALPKNPTGKTVKTELRSWLDQAPPHSTKV